MTPHLLLAALVAIAAGSASAEEITRAGGFADAASRGLFDHDTMVHLTEQPVRIIDVSGMEVVMEVTPLTEIAAHRGGTIRREGEAGGAMAWLCYGTDDMTLWFMSDGEMGDGKVSIIAAQAIAPRLEWGCATLATDIMIEPGIPWLGDQVADTATRFGPSPIGDDRRYSYDSETPAGPQHPPGFKVWQELIYELDEGIIAAAAIMQLTGD